MYRVFLAGRENAGKTSLLYNLHMGRPMDERNDPTKGYNYEVITYNQKTYYELIDPSGKEAVMNYVYPIFWESVKFDFVIYVIDMTAYLKCKGEIQRYTYLSEDRDQLSRILSHQRIRQSSYENPLGARTCDTIFVFLNYKRNESAAIRKVARAFVIDHLRLDKECTVLDEDSKRYIPQRNFVEDTDDLRAMLTSDADGWTSGCLYGRGSMSNSFFNYSVKYDPSKTAKEKEKKASAG